MGKTKLNIPMCAAAVLLFLTLLSIHLTSGLFARYTTTVTASDSARVAKFDVDVTMDSDVIDEDGLVVNCMQGKEGTYSIKVTNKSEVAVKYSIALTMDQSVNATDLMLKTTNNVLPTQNGSTYRFTDLGQLDPVGGATTERTHDFVFGVHDWHTVTGKTTEQKPAYFDWVLTFTVDVTAEQID